MNTKFTAALLLLGACAADEGCGTSRIGPKGGSARSTSDDCPGHIGAVDIPTGVLRDEYEIKVACSTASADVGDAVSPMYVFAPTELPLFGDARFTVEYEGDAGATLLWRSPDVTMEWSAFDATLSPTTFAGGEPAISFQHDRFGEFVLVASPP